MRTSKAPPCKNQRRKDGPPSDIDNPDLDKFPLFAKAVPMRFRLHPGEILFIPGGLWHTAKMLTPSISVNRANPPTGQS
jgi:hypothetical protein